MNPIDQLIHEHDIILKLLHIMNDCVCHDSFNVEKNRPLLLQMVSFLKDFVDPVHHQKEENLLFPAMIEAGLPKENGPIHCMLSEHDMGRHHIQQLEQALLENDSNKIGIRQLVLNYTGLLNEHIAKENQVLFPLAKKIISPQKIEFLTEEFKKISSTQLETLERLEKIELSLRSQIFYHPEQNGF